MSPNLELFLNDLPENISEKEGIYLFYSTYSKESFRFNTSQKEFILNKYNNPILLEEALKILINLPKGLAFSKIIKSIDYNLKFRQNFKGITFKKDFFIKKSNYQSPHEFFNGTQYDIYYKNEMIGNFSFIFTFEKNSLTLRLKYIQGIKGKKNKLDVLSSKINQDWMSKVILFLKKYTEAKKINYIFEIPPRYNTATEKEYRRYAFEIYLKKFLKNNIPLSNIDFKQVPKEFFSEIKTIITSQNPKIKIPRSFIKIKRGLRKK